MISGEIQHSAFYKFVALADAPALAQALRPLTQKLLGAVWVAPEGINGVVAGEAQALDAFEQGLLSGFGGCFAGMPFKRSACVTAPFKRMRVLQKPELVPLGVAGIDTSQPTGVVLAPQEWRALMAQDDVVLIDNRNSFEYRLGHFNKAIDPQVAHFRDFARFMQRHAADWKAQGKRVAMYCTGGIRCEKTSAWMASSGLQVYQLEGGILNYFAQMPDAEADWQGECFVFDNRIALDTQLQETATTLEQVYEAQPDGAWRLERARRLMADD
jgi:UPF0176 protein